MPDFIKFLSGGQWRPTYDTINVVPGPPTSGKTATYVVIVPSNGDIHDGDAVTFTATLRNAVTNGVLSGKTVAIQQNTGSGWTSVGSGTTNGSGVFAVTGLTPNTSRNYRAVFAGDGSYVASTSTTFNLTVRTLQPVTQRYYAVWSQTYKPDNSQDSGVTDVWQNRTIGLPPNNVYKYKSLVGFLNDNVAAWLADAVDNVSLKGRVKVTKIEPDRGGDARILWGFHKENSKPSTWVDANVDQNLETTIIDPATTSTPVSVTALFDESLIDDWKSGSYKGLSFGPADTTGASYIMKGIGNSSGQDPEEPWLEFTVTKWVAT